MDKSKLCPLSNFVVLADELTLLILRLHLTNQHVNILRISTENTILLRRAGLLAHVLLRDDNRNQKAWGRSLIGQEGVNSRLCGILACLRLYDKHFRHCSFTYCFLELFLNTLFFRTMDIFDSVISNLPYCYYSEVMSVSYDICWTTTCVLILQTKLAS